jgi:hypothetical protein
VSDLETCHRCGHTAPTCVRCGRSDLILGGYVSGVGSFCHTFVDEVDRPSCYQLAVLDHLGASSVELVDADVTQVTLDELTELLDDAPTLRAAAARTRRFVRNPDLDDPVGNDWGLVRTPGVGPVRPCPCECSRGGYCGGCGHRGCTRRSS